MTLMNSFKIIPKYGWGWFSQESAVEVPSPFFIEMGSENAIEPFPNRVVGRVISPQHHIYYEYFVALGRKMIVGNEVQYAILLRASAPFSVDHLDIKDADVSGYCIAQAGEKGPG